MGLFDKKICDICGEKIKLLGNRKLDDGNLCKSCAEKLSPWFTGRKKSTVADIRGQLEYREANRQAVADFRVTRTLGNGTKVLLDEGAGKFMVTAASDLASANPDVVDCAQITGCRTDVTDSKSEVFRKDSEGKSVSYNPPQYRHSYDIYMIISVSHPYFDEMRFRVNKNTIVVEPILPGTGFVRPAASGRGSGIGQAIGAGLAGALGANAVNSASPLSDPEYVNAQQLAEEIKAALMNARTGSAASAAAPTAEPAPAAAAPSVCPHCGATLGAPTRFCEFCGSAL